MRAEELNRAKRELFMRNKLIIFLSLGVLCIGMSAAQLVRK